MYLKHCHNEARNDMFEHLDSPKIRKPREESVQAHAARLETIVGYANKLPGTEPPKTQEQVKRIIFRSFPDKASAVEAKT